MSMIVYPLNGVTYSASDVESYLQTRSQGVFASTGNFVASCTGSDRNITIGTGQAWIKNGSFRGKSCTMNAAVTVAIAAADSQPRIDRIVLRFSTSANSASIVVIKGTASSSPSAPSISRNESGDWDLCLYNVRVPAGSIYVSAANIYNTMGDESICGYMRDGVTGIALSQMQTQYEDMIDQYEDALQDAIDAYKTAATGGTLDYNQLVNAPTIDDFATSGSTNLATSGEIYNAGTKAGASASDYSGKLNLIASRDQGARSQTCTKDGCYIFDGHLYSASKMCLTNGEAGSSTGNSGTYTASTNTIASVTGLRKGIYIFVCHGSARTSDSGTVYTGFEPRKNGVAISGLSVSDYITAQSFNQSFKTISVVGISDSSDVFSLLLTVSGGAATINRSAISYMRIS